MPAQDTHQTHAKPADAAHQLACCRRTLAGERAAGQLTPPGGLQSHDAGDAARRTGRQRGTARKLRPALDGDGEQHSVRTRARQSPARQLVSRHEAARPATAAPATGSPQEAASEAEREAGSMTGAPDSDSPTAAEHRCQPDALASSRPAADPAVGAVDRMVCCGTTSQLPDTMSAEDADGAVACAAAAVAADPAAQPVTAGGSPAEAAAVKADPAAVPKRRRKLGRNRAVLDSPDPDGPPRPSHARAQVCEWIL